MEIIDAHQHFWKFDPLIHDWITDDMSVIKKDFLPNDLLSIYQENNIAGCVAVQADQSEAETDFLIKLSATNSFIRGIVGWIDLRATNIDELLTKYTTEPIIKGFRHVLQSEPQRDLMLSLDFKRGINALQARDYSFDILIFTDQLAFASELAETFPEQRFVVDHIAKPDILLKEINEWKAGIETLAANPNVYCKISGMVTEANHKNWTPNDFTPYLDIITTNFGTNRIMYGSDWPVCLLSASYKQVLSIVQDYFSSFSNEDQQKFFAGNAIKFYKL